MNKETSPNGVSSFRRCPFVMPGVRGKFADRQSHSCRAARLASRAWTGNSAGGSTRRLRQQRGCRPNRLISGFGIGGKGDRPFSPANRRGQVGGGLATTGGFGGYDRRGGKVAVSRVAGWRRPAFLGAVAALRLRRPVVKRFQLRSRGAERLVAGLRH